MADLKHKSPTEDDKTLAESPKKQRTSANALIPIESKSKDIVAKTIGPARTSSLLAPTMLLTGHQGAVYTCRFNPSGTYLASGSQDKLILLWKVYGECENFGLLKGHQAAILDLQWSRDGEYIYSASADKTGAVFDVEAQQRVKRFRDHTSFVNSVCSARRGETLVLTGSDDCSTMLWDLRVRGHQINLQNEYQVLAVCFSDDSSQVFTGGIDNDIKVWDLRNQKVLYSLQGHNDTVSGLELSPDGAFLLSTGMDNTVRSWDVRPFVPSGRAVNVYEGSVHDFQKNLLRCSWSPDSTKISGGSADRFVCVWDVASRRLLYKLPGHSGSVNQVEFHPKEPILLSCSDDKKLYLGEIQA